MSIVVFQESGFASIGIIAVMPIGGVLVLERPSLERVKKVCTEMIWLSSVEVYKTNKGFGPHCFMVARLGESAGTSTLTIRLLLAAMVSTCDFPSNCRVGMCDSPSAHFCISVLDVKV